MHLAHGTWAATGLDPFGLLGMALAVAASLMRTRERVLLAGAGAGAAFAAHYAGHGSVPGACLCLVAVLQNLSAARFAARGAPGWLVAAFAATSAIGLALTLGTWAGASSGFAAVGALLASAARLQSDAVRLRLLFTLSAACWCGHDLCIASPCALACEMLTVAGYAHALRRDLRAAAASGTGGVEDGWAEADGAGPRLAA